MTFSIFTEQYGLYRSGRFDSQFRWLVGIQITTQIALGSLLFSILSKLPRESTR